MNFLFLLRTGGLQNQIGKLYVHPYILIEFLIVNILPIQLDRGKFGSNVKILQKGEII